MIKNAKLTYNSSHCLHWSHLSGGIIPYRSSQICIVIFYLAYRVWSKKAIKLWSAKFSETCMLHLLFNWSDVNYFHIPDRQPSCSFICAVKSEKCKTAYYSHWTSRTCSGIRKLISLMRRNGYYHYTDENNWGMRASVVQLKLSD